MRGLRLFPFRARSGQGVFGRGARPLVSLAVLGLALPLCALHAWLFWLRLSEGRLLEGGIALRWAASALLLLALLGLRRRGVSLFWGRKALALWTLVLLIHWAAPAPSAGGGDLPSASSILFVLPASAGSVAVAVGLLWVSRVRAARPVPLRYVLRPGEEMGRNPLAGFPLLLYARPPPA